MSNSHQHFQSVMGKLTITATDKNRGLDLNGIESLEPMILMSASAADIDAATLDDASEGNDVMIALEAGGLMDGKAGHDILIGLAGDNYVKGGGGHDMLIALRGDNVIDGGDGQDTLVYWGGNRADYTVTDKGFGILEIDNGRSTDFVTNVEEIQFRDGSYSVADLFKAGSAPAAPAALVVDAVAPVVADEVVFVDAEEVIVDKIAEEETDEVVVVEEELSDEEAEEGKPATNTDDEVWSCVDQWINDCSPDCEPSGPPVVEEEVVVVDESVDCVVEPPVVEPPVCELPAVCEEEQPVPEECEVEYNWCYTTPSYTDCDLFSWCEPIVEKYVSVVEQICDFSFSYDDKYSLKSDTSHHYSGWSRGGWSKWFGCW